MLTVFATVIFGNKETNMYKYSEDKFINELSQYIASTYNSHYIVKENIQTLDLWESMDIAKENCIGNALKYLMRYGKKEGNNKKDLLKAIHYIILLNHFVSTNDQEMVVDESEPQRKYADFKTALAKMVGEQPSIDPASYINTLPDFKDVQK